MRTMRFAEKRKIEYLEEQKKKNIVERKSKAKRSQAEKYQQEIFFLFLSLEERESKHKAFKKSF